VTRLESARAKLARAEEHAQALDLICQEFLNTNPYMTVGKFDPDSRKYSVHLSVAHEPPTRLSTILGDFLFDLRSALDNAVFELAVLHSGQDPPPDEEGIEFPVFVDIPPFEARKKRRIGALRPEAQTFIRGLQPFQDGKDATASVLWILHELNRIDKHRRLHAVAGRFGNEIVFRDTTPPGLDLTVHGMSPPVPLDDDAELLTMSVGGTKREVKVDVEISFDLTIREGSEIHPEMAFMRLRTLVPVLYGRVSGIISELDQFV
jgi:hypothetical protein